MSTTHAPNAPFADRSWHIISRWEQFHAERRANLLRFLAIGAFYALHLVNQFGLRVAGLDWAPGAGADLAYHRLASALAAAWMLVALAVLVCLERRLFPAALMYLSTLADVLLLSLLLMAGAGANGPLVVGYFLILALAALRFSLPLLWTTCAATLVGYLMVLGHTRFVRGLDVSRHTQLTTMLALAITGVILGQVVRSVRRLAGEYARRLQASSAPTAGSGPAVAVGEGT